MSMSLIETVEVGVGGAASIIFTDIPQDGTDLVLTISCRSSYAIDFLLNVNIIINNSSTGYVTRRLRGNGSTASSEVGPTDGMAIYGTPGSTATSNTFSNVLAYLPNYVSSTNKTLSADGVSENNATGADSSIVAGTWSGTAPITSLTVQDGGGNFAQHSTASLYKITKGSDGTTVVS